MIDPIDGTTNYCQFGRGYAISLALLRNGRPVYGFVLDVERGKLFEGGASETPAGQTSGEPAEEGILHIGFQTMRDFALLGADPDALAECFRGVRYRGCASLELCGIGEEHAGFYVNSHLKLWDFAAAYPDVYKRQLFSHPPRGIDGCPEKNQTERKQLMGLSLIHIYFRAHSNPN